MVGSRQGTFGTTRIRSQYASQHPDLDYLRSQTLHSTSRGRPPSLSTQGGLGRSGAGLGESPRLLFAPSQGGDFVEDVHLPGNGHSGDLLEAVSIDSKRARSAGRANQTLFGAGPKSSRIGGSLGTALVCKYRLVGGSNTGSHPSPNAFSDLLQETSGDNQGKSNSGKLVPPNWGHAHNHVLLCFRLYYRGDQLDPDFPDPVPPKNIVVPATMPHKDAGAAPRPVLVNKPYDGDAPGKGGTTARTPQQAAVHSNPSDERRRLLQEVREHLDLLREFEDVAPEEELANRKRELYAALPPAPPPFGNTKKTRHV